jgi:hypothetical protein
VAVPRALSGRNLFITTTFELLNIFHLMSHDLIAKRKKCHSTSRVVRSYYIVKAREVPGW